MSIKIERKDYEKLLKLLSHMHIQDFKHNMMLPHEIQQKYKFPLQKIRWRLTTIDVIPGNLPEALKHFMTITEPGFGIAIKPMLNDKNIVFQITAEHDSSFGSSSKFFSATCFLDYNKLLELI